MGVTAVNARHWSLILVTLSGAAWPAFARATTLQVPLGARAVSMGGAFSAIADDGTATFWNPAGLPWIAHQEISVAHADLYGSGLKHDFASFTLPLTRSQAVAIDLNELRLGDAELDYGDGRIDLAYGRKFGSLFSAGMSVKYLQRHTDLDGSTVRRGSGAGLDLGVMARPVEVLRIAAVAQDVFDTKIDYSGGDGTVTAYPRTIRVGAALTPRPWGTLAVDVDDRFHGGIEVHPIEAVAIRSGAESDFDGPEGTTWTFGAGLRWSVFRFDYAFVNHPDLASTSHFGLSVGFNFNPSQVRIEKVEANPIYSSLYKSYAREPFGSVQVKNLENAPVSARLRVFVPDLMTSPSEQDVVLRPGATVDLPLTAVFPDRIVNRPGDRPVQVQVSTTYQSLHLPRTEKASARCLAYGPGAIDWSRGVAQAAAYVTTRDPAVELLAREAVLTLDRGMATSGNRNLDFAAAIFDAVSAMGVTYVADPNNPYETISGIPRAVDTIRYPRQTLSIRTGDCDDTTVLLAALFGNVGIGTQFVDVPGHIFLLVDAGVHERNRFALAQEEERYVVHDDGVWIPLETTALSKGFAEAWRIGAESYRAWDSRGKVQLVDVVGAQSRYEPGEPSGDLSMPSLDRNALQAGLVRDLEEISSRRRSFLAARYGADSQELQVSPEARNELAYISYSAGRLDDAKAELESALTSGGESPRTRNNLGAVYMALGDFGKAVQSFTTAAELDAADPGIWLNLGLTHYAAGDSAAADEALVRGLDLSGGYTQACALLGLAPGEEADREGTNRMTAEEARDLLKSALRRVPNPAPEVQGKAGSSPQAVRKKRPVRRWWAGRSAGARSADRADMADLLYWKL